MNSLVIIRAAFNIEHAEVIACARACGATVIDATHGGAPVTPQTAYRCDRPTFPATVAIIVWVGCRPADRTTEQIVADYGELGNMVNIAIGHDDGEQNAAAIERVFAFLGTHAAGGYDAAVTAIVAFWARRGASGRDPAIDTTPEDRYARDLLDTAAELRLWRLMSESDRESVRVAGRLRCDEIRNAETVEGHSRTLS